MDKEKIEERERQTQRVVVISHTQRAGMQGDCALPALVLFSNGNMYRHITHSLLWGVRKSKESKITKEKSVIKKNI